MLDIEFLEKQWRDLDFTAISIFLFFIYLYLENNWQNKLKLSTCMQLDSEIYAIKDDNWTSRWNFIEIFLHLMINIWNLISRESIKEVKLYMIIHFFNLVKMFKLVWACEIWNETHLSKSFLYEVAKNRSM